MEILTMYPFVCVCEGPEAAEPVSGVWATAGWESLCHAGAAERECNTEKTIKGKVSVKKYLFAYHH